MAGLFRLSKKSICGEAAAFPRGEGGFFNAHAWALKKTEEERRQDRFYAQKIHKEVVLA